MKPLRSKSGGLNGRVNTPCSPSIRLNLINFHPQSVLSRESTSDQLSRRTHKQPRGHRHSRYIRYRQWDYSYLPFVLNRQPSILDRTLNGVAPIFSEKEAIAIGTGIDTAMLHVLRRDVCMRAATRRAVSGSRFASCRNTNHTFRAR